MRVSVVAPGELGPSEARRWAELQGGEAGLSSPFLSYSYARILGQHRPNARVAVVEEGGQIGAFLPYELGPGRIASPLGGVLTMTDGVVGGTTAIDLRAAVRLAGLRGWRFRHAPAGQLALRPYAYRWSYHGAEVLSIDLRDGFDAPAPLAGQTSLSKAVRYQCRHLERELGPLRFEWTSAESGHLGRLFAWKVAQLDPERRIFSSAFEDIVADLQASSVDECEVLLASLSVGDQLVAVNLYLRGHRYLCLWQTGYDHAYARYSPGTVLLGLHAAEAARRGLAWIDLGYGQDPYKARAANAAYGILGGAIWASRGEALARSAYRRLLFEPRARRRSLRETTPVGGATPRVGPRAVPTTRRSATASDLPPGGRP